MISEEEVALWHLAVASPAVPGALEVYGDWLLTHDPARGETFHRRLHSTTPIDHRDLVAEERAWASALGLSDTRYLRITLDPLPRQLTIEATRIAELDPILERLPFLSITLDFTSESGNLESAFAHPAMAKIRTLSYNAVYPEENYQSVPSYFGADVIQVLCASPNVTQLESLAVGDDSGSECATKLAAVPFTNLRELRIDNEPIGDAGAFALASSPHMATLRVLALRRCEIGDAGAIAIARSPLRVEDLDVSGNRFGPEGVAALRTMPLRSLRGVPP